MSESVLPAMITINMAFVPFFNILGTIAKQFLDWVVLLQGHLVTIVGEVGAIWKTEASLRS